MNKGRFFFRKQIIKPSEPLAVQLYHSTSPVRPPPIPIPLHPFVLAC